VKGKARQVFFFEKKNQKTFNNERCLETSRPYYQKFFGSFFQKRTLALLFLLLTAVNDPSEMLPDHAQELRAEKIGSQLRCLVCQNESIEDSAAPLAKDLRHLVRVQVAAGDSDQQVIEWVVARYGSFVRLKPPFEPATWLLWFSPLLALAVGGCWIVLGRRKPAAPEPLSDDEQQRLAQLMMRE